jgi:gliding motility-associated-like protein
MLLYTALHQRCSNYFRPIALNCFLMKSFRLFFTLFCPLFMSGIALAQGCTDALSNQICADTPQPMDSLDATPFAFGCFNATESFYYSFQTNSIANVGDVDIEVNNYDCDDILGNDSIQVLVVAIPANSDPCDPANYINPVCYSDSASNFSFNVSNLSNNQTYLVIAGSNHDSVNYGPCAFDVNISGSAVDVVAGITNGNILISLGESVQLNVAGADTTASINWSPAQYLDNSSSQNPTAIPEETTSFQVTAYVGGCELTDIVSVTVSDPIQIYNTFTPNGDGINDAWRIKYIERFPNCQVEVFDRWGQSIFKSVGYAQDWDGTYKGRFLPTSAYYYVIELNSLDVTIPPITGVVSIVH